MLSIESNNSTLFVPAIVQSNTFLNLTSYYSILYEGNVYSPNDFKNNIDSYQIKYGGYITLTIVMILLFIICSLYYYKNLKY